MPQEQLEEIGRVKGFFAKPSVAVVELTARLKVGEMVYVKGETTDFQQRVESMQINHQPVDEAQMGSSIGLKVQARCRVHDVVYRLRAAAQGS